MNNEKKKSFLNEKEKLKQEKMLLQLLNDRELMEETIDHALSKNLKNDTKRLFCICSFLGKRFAPCIIAIISTLLLHIHFGVTPFVLDDREQKLKIKKELDSKGNLRYETQYIPFENMSESIMYVNTWEKTNNNMYKRQIKKYATSELNSQRIEAIVNNWNNDSFNLEDILGKAILEYNEIKNKLTEEEINSSPFIQAVIYSENDDDVIIVKENIWENVATTIVWLFVVGFINSAIINSKKRFLSDDYSEYCKMITDKYPHINTRELRKKLEIRKSNYDWLVR